MEATHTATRKAQHGVTLIEMCVVCSIAAALVGTALQS